MLVIPEWVQDYKGEYPFIILRKDKTKRTKITGGKKSPCSSFLNVSIRNPNNRRARLFRFPAKFREWRITAEENYRQKRSGRTEEDGCLAEFQAERRKEEQLLQVVQLTKILEKKGGKISSNLKIPVIT